MHISGRVIVGFIIIFIGLSALFSSLHLHFIINQFMVPLMFGLFSIYFWQKKHPFIGSILFAIGVIVFANQTLDMNVAGLVVAVVMVYFGIRLLRQDKTSTIKKSSPKLSSEEQQWQIWEDEDFYKNTHSFNEAQFDFDEAKADESHSNDQADDQQQRSSLKNKYKQLEDEVEREIANIRNKFIRAFSLDKQSSSQQTEDETEYEHDQQQDYEADVRRAEQNYRRTHSAFDDQEAHYSARPHKRQKQVVSSIFGDFMLRNHRYELHDLKVSNGIGDVKIDLSKAIISPGTTTLEISGWLGDISIYIPYDLDVLVRADVWMGDLNILNNKQSGVSRRITMETSDYRQAMKKVILKISLGLGDVNVRYV